MCTCNRGQSKEGTEGGEASVGAMYQKSTCACIAGHGQARPKRPNADQSRRVSSLACAPFERQDPARPPPGTPPSRRKKSPGSRPPSVAERGWLPCRTRRRPPKRPEGGDNGKEEGGRLQYLQTPSTCVVTQNLSLRLHIYRHFAPLHVP
jgi:hypothetical protein